MESMRESIWSKRFFHGGEASVDSVELRVDSGELTVYSVELSVYAVKTGVNAVKAVFEPAFHGAETGQHQGTERHADGNNCPELLIHEWTPRSHQYD